MHQPTHLHPNVIRSNHKSEHPPPKPEVQKPNGEKSASVLKPAAEKRMALHDLDLLHLRHCNASYPRHCTLPQNKKDDLTFIRLLGGKQ